MNNGMVGDPRESDENGAGGGARWPAPSDRPAELPPLNAGYSVSDEQVAQFWRDGFIVLRGVLSRDEIGAYGAVIRATAMRRFAANDMQAAAHGAFFSADPGPALRRRGGAAGSVWRRASGRSPPACCGCRRCGIFHEQALFKQPGGTDSHWHQDQYYWPLATDRSLGLWMPLVDCSREMGSIRFVRRSHRYGDLAGRDISDESAHHFDEFIARERLEVCQTEALAAGDCTFHLGWTVHGAPANRSAAMREAMIVTFYPDGTRGRHPEQPVAGQRRARVSGRPPAGRTGRQRAQHGGLPRSAGRSPGGTVELVSGVRSALMMEEGVALAELAGREGSDVPGGRGSLARGGLG